MASSLVDGITTLRPPTGDSGVTWVAFPGIVGNAEIEFTLSDDGKTIAPDSMFSRVLDYGDTVITAEHPPAHDPVGYLRHLYEQLRGRHAIVTPLSWGANPANQLYHLHRAMPADMQAPRSLTLAFISPCTGADDLRWRPQAAVKAVRALHIPVSWGGPFMRVLGPSGFIPVGDRCTLKYQGRLDHALPLLSRSLRGSSRLVEHLDAIAASSGFGLPIAGTGQDVLCINLAPEPGQEQSADETINVPVAVASLRRFYPDLVDDDDWELHGASHHGVPGIDYAIYADLVDRLRVHAGHPLPVR